MKSMRPPSVAIFFMTYFYRAGGGAWRPRPPLDPLLCLENTVSAFKLVGQNKFADGVVKVDVLQFTKGITRVRVQGIIFRGQASSSLCYHTKFLFRIFHN